MIHKMRINRFALLSKNVILFMIMSQYLLILETKDATMP